MNVAFAPVSDTIAAGKIWLRMIEGREIAIDPYLPGDVRLLWLRMTVGRKMANDPYLAGDVRVPSMCNSRFVYL